MSIEIKKEVILLEVYIDEEDLTKYNWRFPTPINVDNMVGMLERIKLSLLLK